MLFPRLTSRSASLEVKRRILNQAPHMGGKRLKRMVRTHSRKGNMNSFVGDFESRLDRFLYRCNVVPSIFAARKVIGNKHVLVNGETENSTHRLLKPGDIVEPASRSYDLFKRLFRRRLANNTFVFKREGTRSAVKPLRGTPGPAIKIDRSALMADGATVAESYRRLPLPARFGGSGATPAVGSPGDARAAQAWPAARQAELDVIVPSVLSALVPEESALTVELERCKGELSVRAAAQQSGSPAPPLTLAWSPPEGNLPDRSVVEVNRVALRRMLLGLLALRPTGGTGSL